VNDLQDAFGHEVMDYLNGKPAFEVIERDDGVVDLSGGPENYFAPFRRWPAHQRRAMRFVRGRVLDVGSGAGRVALHLQERGHEVLCLDESPLALETCRRRGALHTQEMSVYRVSKKLGMFDTILMMGANLGLLADADRGRRLLQRFDRITNPGARIIGETRNPYGSDDPVHLAYHQFNRDRGRAAGQVRIRVRYKNYMTPWFDYLLSSPDELRTMLDGTPWRLRRILDADTGAYVAIIEKS
jgi:SAM-dependent methyltransferase|tara:strand:+ start:3038 stop:3763 length:726 start_codon:yes stop_codon:yes gene_type:complete